jgi:outer membrane receptor protein involved in Fe transport
MKSTKLILAFFLVLYSHFIFAQDPDDGRGKIYGTVIDSSASVPVEYAVVSLIDKTTNKPVNGAICDEKGKFTLTKIKAGEYKLTISFLGYATHTIDKIRITESQESVELAEIKLGEDQKYLSEVLVEGKKSLIEEKVDRVVYNAENDATNKGGDATDVLRKAPMLSVDLDGNVSLRGSQNVKILINGKPSTITAGSVADALKQIPSDQIKAVEVITAPSARYDAEGSSGIINIVLKKNTRQGASLGVDGSVGLRGSSLGLNGGYRKGKMGLSLSGHGRAAYNIRGRFENNQQTTNTDGTQTINTQEADTRNQRLFGSYILGWDYDINKNNFLTSSVKYSFRNVNTFQDDLLTNNYRNDTLLSTNTRNVETADLSGTVDFNLNYIHTFKKPQHEFSLLGLYSRNNRNNDFTNKIMDSSDLSAIASRLKNKNNSVNQEITFQADYQLPIGKIQLLEIGGKNITRNVTSDYQYFYASGSSGDYVASQNSQQKNALNYNQNVTAGYASYTLNFLKTYTLKAGGRYEYTTISAHLKDQQNIDIPSYGIVVPSVNISKKSKKGNMLKASFNRRIQRPSIQFLNPNIQASNPLSVTIGNPSLKPEFTNNYELSYSTYFKSSSVTLTGFMRNTNNAIQSVRDILGTDTIRTTYQNIGKEDAYGFNLYTNLSFSNKFSLNGGTDVYYTVLKNNNPNPLYNARNEGWVASYRLSGTYNFTKTLALQLFGFYRGRQVQLQGFQGGFGIYSLSLKKDFSNKKGSIGFGAENFFTPSFHIRNELHSPVIDQKGLTTLHTMNFKINFSYRIGKTNDEKPRKRKSINNDDLKEERDNNPTGNSPAPQGPAPGNNNMVKPAPKQEIPVTK